MWSEQYAELAEVAGGFIHEIKNHLSTLGLNLQLLAEDFAEPQSQRERRAHDRIQRLQGECHRLVDVSNDFLRGSGIDIKLYLPADLPRLGLDRELFKQALLNLMLNAQQAMPEGGTLTIQA